MRPLFPALLAVLVACACAPKKIPGTDIDDSSDTRAILDVVNKYRVAVEQKNSQAIIDLADKTFRDDGGSSNTDDDLDYQTLFTTLPARFQRIDEVRLNLDVRKVEFDEAQNKATVSYQYTMSFKMPSLTSKPQSETDLKQMSLARVGEKSWKITSGI